MMKVAGIKVLFDGILKCRGREEGSGKGLNPPLCTKAIWSNRAAPGNLVSLQMQFLAARFRPFWSDGQMGTLLSAADSLIYLLSVVFGHFGAMRNLEMDVHKDVHTQVW